MESREFRGKITHTEKTIQRLFQTEYHTYDTAQMLMQMAVGGLLVIVAALSDVNIAIQGVLLLVGCWLIISRDFPASYKADQVLKVHRGNLPVMEYIFAEEGVTVSGEGNMRLKYKQFQRLVEDEQYLYLFLGRNSVCMMDRKEITPSMGNFMVFIEEKTGLKWTRNKSLVAMNLWDVVEVFRNRNKN